MFYIVQDGLYNDDYKTKINKKLKFVWNTEKQCLSLIYQQATFRKLRLL